MNPSCIVLKLELNDRQRPKQAIYEDSFRTAISTAQTQSARSFETRAVNDLAEIQKSSYKILVQQENQHDFGISNTGQRRSQGNRAQRLVSVVAATLVPATSLNADAETLAFFASMATDDDAFRQGITGLTSSIYGESWCNYKLSRNRATVATEAMQG
jgi:hypothetical protein